MSSTGSSDDEAPTINNITDSSVTAGAGLAPPEGADNADNANNMQTITTTGESAESNGSPEYLRTRDREGNICLRTKSTVSCNNLGYTKEGEGDDDDGDNEVTDKEDDGTEGGGGGYGGGGGGEVGMGMGVYGGYASIYQQYGGTYSGGYNNTSGHGSSGNFQFTNSILGNFNSSGGNLMFTNYGSQDNESYTDQFIYPQQEQMMQQQQQQDQQTPQQLLPACITNRLLQSGAQQLQSPQLLPPPLLPSLPLQPPPPLPHSPTTTTPKAGGGGGGGGRKTKRKDNAGGSGEPEPKRTRGGRGGDANAAGGGSGGGDGMACHCLIEMYTGISGPVGQRQTAMELNGLWAHMHNLRLSLAEMKSVHGGIQLANSEKLLRDIAWLRGSAQAIEETKLLHPLELEAVDVICTAADVAEAEVSVLLEETRTGRPSARVVIVDQEYHRLLKQNSKQANSSLRFMVRVVGGALSSRVDIASILSLECTKITKGGRTTTNTSSSSTTQKTDSTKTDFPFSVTSCKPMCVAHGVWCIDCSADNGSRKLPVSFAFKVSVCATLEESGMQAEVITTTGYSNKYVVFTNECQYDDGNTELFKAICFGLDRTSLTWCAFANRIQRHYVSSLRQTLHTIPRYLSAWELEHFHKTFLGDSGEITIGNFGGFWEWYVKVLHQLRHGKFITELWLNGAIWGFVPRPLITAALEGKPSGSFVIRFSETNPGFFAVCYVKQDGTTSNKVFKDTLVNQSHTLADAVHDDGALSFVATVRYNDLEYDKGPMQPAFTFEQKSDVFKRFYSKQKGALQKSGYESDD